MANTEYIKSLKKHMSGTLSSADKKNLLSHIENDEELDSLLQDDIRSMSPAVDSNTSSDIFRNIQAEIKSKKRIAFKSRIRFISRAAAIIILPVLASWLTYIFTRTDTGTVTIPPAVISVPKGQTVNMVLPDSTLIWLNSASTLTYNNQFGISDRTVQLSGEAYFEVARNKDLPFIVKTSDFDIRVTGTSFNVKAYPEDIHNTVTLISGSIDMITANEIYSLKPNQQIVYDRNLNKIMSQDSPSPELFTQWRTNSMRYNNELMEHVARDIERLFNVSVAFDNERIKNYLFTGTINNINLINFLETICTVAPVRYEILQGDIIFYEVPERVKNYITVE